MRLVVQRVASAKVIIDEEEYSSIKGGYLIYLGITETDTKDEVLKLAHKISGLRIFEDENQKMNLNLETVKGEILVVSQFTLYADMKRGNRPSFTKAAHPDLAIPLYELFVKKLSEKFVVKTGIFGANMQIESINDGPVTLIYETEDL